jgi:hypothetical protein
VVLDDYVAWVHANKPKKDYDFYRYRLQSFVAFVGKQLTVAELTHQHIYDWLDAPKKRRPWGVLCKKENAARREFSRRVFGTDFGVRREVCSWRLGATSARGRADTLSFL